MRTCTALSPWLSVLWNCSVWPLEGVAITGKKKQNKNTVYSIYWSLSSERLWCLIRKEETCSLCPWLHTRTLYGSVFTNLIRDVTEGGGCDAEEEGTEAELQGRLCRNKIKVARMWDGDISARGGGTRRWVREQRGVKEASVLAQWVGLNRPAGMCELQQQHSTVNPHCHPSFPPSLHHPIPPTQRPGWWKQNRWWNKREAKRKDKQDSVGSSLYIVVTTQFGKPV